MMNFKELWTKKTFVSLGLGQFLSLLITSTGFSSSELARKGINAPTSQSFLNYVLLALVYGGIMIYRRKALKAKWYYYVLLALVDVEANFLVVMAYQYTSDIPNKCHTTGLLVNPICHNSYLAFLEDKIQIQKIYRRRPIKRPIKSILKRNELKSIHWSAGAISGSTMVNLSLLTSDKWAVLIRIFTFHEKVDWMYFIASAAAIGLVIYSGGDKEGDRNGSEVTNENEEQSKHFDEEAALGNPDEKITAGSSKTGETSEWNVASTKRNDTENKNVGKGA